MRSGYIINYSLKEIARLASNVNNSSLRGVPGIFFFITNVLYEVYQTDIKLFMCFHNFTGIVHDSLALMLK